MHPNYYLSPIAIAIAIGLASPIKAAEPIALDKARLPELVQKFQFVVPNSLKNAPTAVNSLHFLKQHTDFNKVTHVRMQQYYEGFPVLSGYLIVHSKHKASKLSLISSDVSMNGKIFDGLEADLGQVPNDFVKNGALVLQQFKDNYANEAISQEQVTPIVYMDEKHQAHWAYKISLLVTYQNKIPARPTAIVDAQTQKPFVQWNDIKTATVAVKGRGFGGNSKVGEVEYGKQLPLLDLTRNDQTNLCFMENDEVKVIDMMHKYGTKKAAMKFACPAEGVNVPAVVYQTGYDRDGYDKYNGAASPSNDALYAGYVIKHMYFDWYGLQVLTQANGSTMKLVMRVHYGDGYENAYWDGAQMTFGDGDTMMYPLVSLGVGGHEVSHGFTEQHSDLQYFGQSGGLNESFSDMAAQAAEFYSTGKGSWKIGAEIMKEDSGYDALRYMDKPSRDGHSIDTADEYTKDLDVHYSSGVYNHMFYILSNMPGWDIRKSFDVMVKANMDYWTPDANFNEAGCGVISAARDLKFPVDDVKSALKLVAVNYSSCK